MSTTLSYMQNDFEGEVTPAKALGAVRRHRGRNQYHGGLLEQQLLEYKTKPTRAKTRENRSEKKLTKFDVVVVVHSRITVI